MRSYTPFLLLAACTAPGDSHDKYGSTDSVLTADSAADTAAGDSARDSTADSGTTRPRPVLADYDSEPRESTPRSDGYTHVDSPTLVPRLTDLGANTYAFLIYHSPTDWDDLAEYVQLAEPAGLNTWVYLVPPAERPASYPPYEGDYVAWAQAIGELAASHPSIHAIAMDDFDGDLATFTGSYVCEMMDAAHAAAPDLKFYAVDYHPYVLSDLASAESHACVDGVIFPYRDLDDNSAMRSEIDDIAAMEDDLGDTYTITYPWNLPSSAGDRGLYTSTCAAGTMSFGCG